jgi:hypothetical protein
MPLFVEKNFIKCLFFVYSFDKIKSHQPPAGGSRQSLTLGRPPAARGG